LWDSRYGYIAYRRHGAIIGETAANNKQIDRSSQKSALAGRHKSP
jgi:hypothetical protein